MIEREWARRFAEDWIESWNSHDMERILSHYSDNFEMISPLILERMGIREGKIKGKDAVREYWLPGLSFQPPLKLELIDVFVGISELTVYYRSIGRRLVVETLFMNAENKVTRGFAQWSVLNESSI